MLDWVSRFVLTFSLSACVAVGAWAGPVEPDSTEVNHSSTRWVKQLIDNKFQINDPEVDYPKFPRFLRNVYNWGDRTFNSYDTTYVVGTGKNWKFYGRNRNWIDGYSLYFNDSENGGRVDMFSDIRADVGAYLCFMAVNVGYEWNINDIFTGTKDQRRMFDFSFTCALFSAELNYQSTKGGTTIYRFGDYDPGYSLRYKISGVSNKSFSVNAYYFFNHRKYSQAAAYCFSKYQRKSAGSWILGFGYTRQKIMMDFSDLPVEMMMALPELSPNYRFHYTDYCLVGGYAYNCVMPHNWLFNVTFMPSVGYKRSEVPETNGRRNMLALGASLRLSMTYNHKALFTNAQLRLSENTYSSDNYTFFNYLGVASLTVGVRF